MLVSSMCQAVECIVRTRHLVLLVTGWLIASLICGRLFRIPAHAELFSLFHLFTLFLDEYDYTARVQHVLHTTGCS